eukprot:TRINITY_DN5575_c0_g1_i1.p1 TRINITY_DN5575_c0_g1~~TRINITY_DN5575_c0_g1_i1.p1  ORF type:complete len:1557 (+),score=293.84 TRINITY_DN5575_c0_g1_i1:275-4945(+)
MGKEKEHGKKVKTGPSSAAAFGSMVGGTGAFGFGGAAVYNQLPHELTVAFRKLSKKDILTRQKGMLEIIDYLDVLQPECTMEDALIERWVFEWGNIITDPENTNRVLACRTMSSIGTFLGRRLAPHLKSIFPAWFCAKFDIVGDVGVKAMNYLSEVFPEKKHAGLIIFCKDEIFGYIEQCLNETSQSIQVKYGLEKEYAEERYERVNYNSIQALIYLCEFFSSQDQEYFISSCQTLLSTKFWTKFNSASVYVRNSMYSLLFAILRHTPELAHYFEQNVNSFSANVFSCLKETEKYCHSSLWDMIILYINEIPCFWNNLQSPKKQVLQKLYTVSKACFYGSSDVVFPKLLTFFSSVPDEISTKFNFYNDYLKNLWNGLMSNELRASDQEALISCYMDSILYVLLQKTSIIDPATFIDDNYISIFRAFIKYEKDVSKYLLPGLLSFLNKLGNRDNCQEYYKQIWIALLLVASEFLSLDSNEMKEENLISCTKLNNFISSSNALPECPERYNFYSEIASSLQLACDNQLTYQLMVISSVSKIVPQIIVNDENTKLVLLNIEKYSSSGNQEILHFLLKILMVVLLEKEDKEIYEQTLVTIATNNRHLIRNLLELVPKGDQRWNHEILNAIAIESVYDISKDDDTKLLSFLIENTFLSNDTFSSVFNTLLDKLDTVIEEGTGSLNNLFKLLFSVVVSDTFNTPQVVNLLIRIFSLREFDEIKQESTQLWDKVLNFLKSQENSVSKYIRPLIKELWIRILSSSIRIDTASLLALDCYSKFNSILPDLVYYSADQWSTLISPITRLVSKSTLSLRINSTLPYYREDISKLEKYMNVVNFVSHVLLKIAEYSDSIFENMVWIGAEMIKVKYLHQGKIHSDYDITLRRFWDHISHEVDDLFIDIVDKSMNNSFDSYLMDIFQRILESAKLNNDFIGAVTLFLQHCPDQWLQTHSGNINQMMEGCTSQLVRAVLFVLVDNMSDVDVTALKNTQFEKIISIGKQENVTVLDFVDELNIYNVVTLAQSGNSEDQVYPLIELLNSFLRSSNTESSYIILELALVLLREKELLPPRNHSIYTLLFDYLFKILQGDIASIENWVDMSLAYEVLPELTAFGIERNNMESEGDVVILDGEVVRASLQPEVQTRTVTDWDISLNRCYKQVSGSFLTIPSWVLSTMVDEYLLSSLSGAALHCSIYSLESSDPLYEMTLYEYLHYPSSNVIIAASKILMKNVKSLNKRSVIRKDQEEQERIVPIPEQLQEIISDIDLYSTETSYIQAMTLLNAWDLMLEFLKTKNLKSKEDLTSWIRETVLYSTNFVAYLFEHIITSVPPPEEITSDLSSSCAFIYQKTLENLPIFVRNWWNDITSRNITTEIEKYTTKYVSPNIIRNELVLVEKFRANPENFIPKKEYVRTSNLSVGHGVFSVKSRRSNTSTEILSTYEKDAFTLTITFEISGTHPLQIPNVSFSNHKGFKDKLTRKWLLSMTMLLLTKNGSVLDAVLLWKDALDKHLEGVELCPICYAVFHASDQSLPTLKCRTCNHKFHPSCMYQWFNTSHKNECPMCKTAFS